MKRRGYHQAISDDTGVSDDRELAKIEELMRLQTGGVLDHLDREQFGEIARVARDALLFLNER